MARTTALGYTPQYQINYNGNDITGQFNDRVTMIKIISGQGNGEGDKLDITLDDRDWAIATPDVNQGSGGVTLGVFLGYAESGLYDQGTFQINKVILTGMPKSMTIQGTSQGFLSALKSPLITHFDGKTVADIIGAIAQSAGVGAAVDPELGSQVVQFYNQHSSSMHILQDLERTYDGLAKFQDSMLSFTKRGSGLSASGTFAGGIALTPEDFGSWEWAIASRTAYSKVRASYWDRVQHQLKWLQNSSTASAAPNGPPYMIKRAFNTQSEAQAAADSMMGSLNRQLVTGTITLAKGDPSIRGGMPFTVSGMKSDAMDGSYVVNTATHAYTKDAGIITVLNFTSTNDDSSSFAQLIAGQQMDFGAIPPTAPRMSPL